MSHSHCLTRPPHPNSHLRPPAHRNHPTWLQGALACTASATSALSVASRVELTAGRGPQSRSMARALGKMSASCSLPALHTSGSRPIENGSGGRLTTLKLPKVGAAPRKAAPTPAKKGILKSNSGEASTDAEQAAAATKMQAIQRGKAGRAKSRSKLGESAAAGSEAAVGELEEGAEVGAEEIATEGTAEEAAPEGAVEGGEAEGGAEAEAVAEAEAEVAEAGEVAEEPAADAVDGEAAAEPAVEEAAADGVAGGEAVAEGAPAEGAEEPAAAE